MPLDFESGSSAAKTVIVVDTGFSPEAGERRGRVLQRRPAQALRELSRRTRSPSRRHAPALRPRRQPRRLPRRTHLVPACRTRLRDRCRACGTGNCPTSSTPTTCATSSAGPSTAGQPDRRSSRARRRRRAAPGRRVTLPDCRWSGCAPNADGSCSPPTHATTTPTSNCATRSRRSWTYQEMLAGFDTVLELADGPEHVVPGHDPAVITLPRRLRRPPTVVTMHRHPAPPTTSPTTDAPRHRFTQETSPWTSAFPTRSRTSVPPCRVRVQDARARCPRPGAQPRVSVGPRRLMGQQGLLGLTIPEAKGGQGACCSPPSSRSRPSPAHAPDRADIVQAGNFGAIRTFAAYATGEQREKYLPACWPATSSSGWA